jgi:hypothetical protein
MAIALVLDTITGTKEWLPDLSIWSLTQGNWSCDCNRNVLDVDTGVEEGVCGGCERFLVIEVTSEDEEETLKLQQMYTLQDFNEDYPPDLLKKYNII